MKIVIDFDATDAPPLRGQQEGAYFHGFYHHYCYPSARETIGRVAAAAIAKKVLAHFCPDLETLAWVKTVQDIPAKVDPLTVTSADIESNIFRTGDPAAAEAMIARIKEVRPEGNSIGGTIACVVRGCPPGLLHGRRKSPH